MPESSNLIIGRQAPYLVEYLVQRLPAIRAIKCFRPPSSQPIQDDPSITIPEQAIIEQGLAIRDNLHLPFWDSVFVHLLTHPTHAPAILSRAALHNPQDSDSFNVPREDCTESHLCQIIQRLPSGKILAISSKVFTAGGEALHLPMLDFHCPASGPTEKLVRAILGRLGLHGYLVGSGRSYHFYGRQLVDERSLLTILGNSLLFCPVIDRAWIAHQIIERACGLRISPGKEYRDCPEVICEV